MSTQDAIGRAIRIELARSGRRHRDLASSLGITPATLSNWLGGRYPFGVDRLDQIARALGWTDAFDLMDRARAEAGQTERVAG